VFLDAMRKTSSEQENIMEVNDEHEGRERQFSLEVGRNGSNYYRSKGNQE